MNLMLIIIESFYKNHWPYKQYRNINNLRETFSPGPGFEPAGTLTN